ncbi:hypothetical protein G7Y89_g4062 [Cudoniella acicularis]|uniref:Uncharacterized protein n=1 Tax=Cudoniella acicularis TaxID=354080 RepID=A0A8H4RR04_9HELO|nr:hypothetical protein G7Y89_g4062 [Cudoniella acicularis]
MSYIYDDEENIDIRFRRGRESPLPVVYPERRYHPARPYYDERHSSSYLVPATSGGIRRSRSTGHRASPPPAPVIINNRIDIDDYEDRRTDRYLPVASPPRRHRSRSRSHSRVSSNSSREDRYEIERIRERTRREVELDVLREQEIKQRELERTKEAARRDAEFGLLRNQEVKDRELERVRREAEYDLLRTQELKDRELERAKEIARREAEMETRREREFKNLKGYELELARDKARREIEAEMSRERERAKYEEEKIREKARKEMEKEKARVDQATKETELEKTRRELAAFKLERERAEEAKRIKEELEFKRLREEKSREEERKRSEKEAKEAVEEFKKKEAERVAKEKKEREERDKEYERRLEDDLRRSGLDERQISVITKKEPPIDPNRPTYTRMSRKHLSIETLNKYRIDYEFDVVRTNSTQLMKHANLPQDPEFVLIKRWVPEFEQDFLWAHTREIRERRQPMMLGIEGRKHHGEAEFEWVRKKEHHKRKPSPSPLLTFLAGGKRS